MSVALNARTGQFDRTLSLRDAVLLHRGPDRVGDDAGTYVGREEALVGRVFGMADPEWLEIDEVARHHALRAGWLNEGTQGRDARDGVELRHEEVDDVLDGRVAGHRAEELAEAARGAGDRGG